MQRSRRGPALASALATAIVVAACGGGAPAATPTAAPPTVAPPTAAPATQAPTAATPTAEATNPATGPANVEAPATVEAGKQFDVAWTGPNGDRDYVTIVAPGATEWTNEPYFYTANGNPGRMTAPAAPGPYVLWYVTGSDEQILFRRDITVTPFQGSLLAPETFAA